MVSFECPVCRITIEPHSNADRLEVARVGGYTCVVGKDEYHSGDLVAYIPEASIVPDDILEELGLTDKLSGKKHNRVKAVKLRGVLSQGILYALHGKRLVGKKIKEGDDVRSVLGVEKYVPEVPTQLAGAVMPMSGLLTYDIENLKRYDSVFRDGEMVFMTEKILGRVILKSVSQDYLLRKNGTEYE